MSCPTNKCINGGKCSTKLNGNYVCQCTSPYSGINCQLGFFYLKNFCQFFSNFFFVYLINRRNGFEWSNNIDKFL